MESSTITAISTLFTAMNSWQAGTVIVFIVLFLPGLFLLAILKLAASLGRLEAVIRADRAEDNKKFEAMVTLSEKHFTSFESKYDNNVYLVRNYEKLSGELATIVHLNTQAITRLVDRIDFSRNSASVKPKGQEQ
ncbi:MAG: hypothetical protein P4L42_15510 [Desulfocapsaceae bacterium]|nr:hypothetical protein [Desulfocapsaceae bacterium]